ncbi:MAG: hypothetical protein P8X76_05820 [Maritimibacter sp.]
MERFQSWAEIEAFEDARFRITGPTEAEVKLKQAVARGEPCLLDGVPGPYHKTRPNAPKSWEHLPGTRHIRADVLRFFLLGGANDAPITEKGTSVDGAWISGKLDISYCQISANTLLGNSYFERRLSASGTAFGANVSLSGSNLPAFHAVGARIDGQLSLEKISLRGGHDKTLFLQNARIGSGLFFRRVRACKGQLDLSAAQVARLVDDVDSWDQVEQLLLDGFTYTSLTGSSTFTDAERRLAWLAKADKSVSNFRPAPYTQLAKTLSAMGHANEARKVRVALEGKLWEHARDERRVELDGSVGAGMRSIGADLVNGVTWLWQQFLRLLIGYGYKPTRALWVLVVLIGALSVTAQKAWDEGDFAPSAGVILNSDAWAEADSAPNPAEAWGETPAGKDWETFYPLTYAADVVIPIIELGQTAAWAPSTNRGPWGWHLWWARWVFTALGWIVTALGAAAISGIIRRE